jgi:radical SAM superfamily enzyme YgiQ (UPF0313 family)
LRDLRLSKLISFVQPNFQQGPKEANSYYLPYSIATLWSYAQTSSIVKEQYALDRIIFKRDNINELAAQLSTNHIVGFSTYIWNKNYNYTLARKIKELNSDVICVFGGPEIPIQNPDIFQQLPFIDVVVKKEGELSFRSLLENFPNIDTVQGLLINRNGTVVDTGNATRIDDLDQIPSPYTTGFFDRLVKENPTVEWAATLETNRGCPYQCTFCDWGSLIYSKIKQFNLARVYEEIEWIAKNRCGFLFIADANFGVFPERDNLIIDHLIEQQKKYGYPYTFTVSWAKNQKQEVVDIAAKLVSSGTFNNGLTISVQTMTDSVLDNIKRKNLNQHKIEDIFKLCSHKQVPVTTEVILGLPGETLATWKSSVYKLFESGNHTGVDITQVELLENAEMNQVQKQIYDMKTTLVYDYLGTNVDEHHESIAVVSSTRDMPLEDMISAQAFNTYINTFHIGGITAILSRFLRRYKNIGYQEFYTELYEYLYKLDWFVLEEQKVKKYFQNWMTDGRINHEDIGVEIHGYNLIYRTLINLHNENKIDWLYVEIDNWLDRYDLDAVLKHDLISVQKNYFLQYRDITVVKTINVTYDIWNYILGGSLTNPTTYTFTFTDDRTISNNTFLELLYYGRRRNFGKAHIKYE